MRRHRTEEDYLTHGSMKKRNGCNDDDDDDEVDRSRVYYIRRTIKFIVSQKNKERKPGR